MAMTAATKATRVARLERKLAAFDTRTAELEADLVRRKDVRKGIAHDLKVLNLTRAIGETAVSTD